MADNRGTRFGEIEYTLDDIERARNERLELERIDRNSNIDSMVETIDSNFREIARHGGGPAGLDGLDGESGADGSNVEYIYCRADEMKIGVQYPDTVDGIRQLFFNVENSAITDASGNRYVNYPSNSNPRVKWFDHAQGVTREFKNEYALIRVKRGDTWFYPSEPVLWAHWGETGRDGDGVEYIFLLSNKSTTEDPGILTSVKKIGEMTAAQEAIYNIDDFYPGRSWFNEANMDAARKALKAAGAEMIESEFENRWRSYFGFCDGGYDWTDEPIGTDPLHLYEYVSIRKSTTDENDKKTWGNFSEPALWSNYSLPSRTFIIYKNMIDTQTPTKIDNGKGWWDTTTDKLIFNKSGYELPSGWTDENTEPEDNEITWMCSGIFKSTGENVYWSKPMRITGRDGKQGEDGTTIEFIYAHSNNTPSYPTTDKETTDSNPGVINTKEELFDAIEGDTTHNPKYAEYNGQKWYDRAQPISPDDPTEWVFSRRREKESDPWEYDDAPIIWAHWGEDGTDGDGVEYIFTRTLEQVAPQAPVKYNTLNNDQKKIFQIDDFVPSTEWFGKPKSRVNAQKALGREITNTEWNNYFGFDVTTVMWYDNPREVNALSPFQWVSIRRSTADEETGGKRFWEDFSDPVLWNSYGKSTMTFILYCNVSDGIVPPTLRTPVGGFWNVNTKKLVKDKDNLTTPYTYDALASGVTSEDRENHINVWEDDNEDVDDKIAWMSSATFGDDGNIIGTWSSPFRITGHNGEPGADGSNLQYIYARCDETPKYPKRTDFDSDSAYIEGLDRFFDDVDDTDNTGYWPSTNLPQDNATKWTDNPQGIENIDGHRTEWVWSRSLEAGKEDSPANWEYAPAPVKWARWGEDGTDGDGIEYIFYHGTSIDEHNPNKELSTDDQKAIYQMREFYPGEEWFDKAGQKEKVEEQLGKTFSDAEWTALKNYFNLGWTDNPSGVDFEYPFEWVSIRRTENDPEDASGKIWGPFSDPKPWANYNIDTRLFMVYCNIDGENTVPTKPDSNYGMWDKSVGLIGGTWNDTIWTPADPNNFAAPVYNENNPGGDQIGVWSDANVDDPTKIAWLCSGTYAENGRSISWSEPFRITGAEGKPGADGSNIEFVYCLSEETPKYPPASNYNNRISFFENIENAKYKNVEEGEPNYLDPIIYDKDNMYIDPDSGIAYYIYNGTYWTDSPQGIEDAEGKRKEWVWSRSLPANATTGTQWTFPPTPVIWAHWGEDGTDGDGVEYIFILRTSRNAYPGTDNDISTWNGHWDLFLGDSATATAKAAYNMDDFVPNPAWFNANRSAVESAMNSESPNSFNSSHWTSMVNTFTNYVLGDWEDNPLDLVPSNAYEFVSIRKSIDGKWGLYSYPKLWSKYNTTTLKVFAFTSTTLHEDISDYQPTGLTGNNIPSGCTYNGNPVDVTWSDGPQPSDAKPLVWMTSATITENEDGTGYILLDSWSSPSKMTDTAEFQVEWATNDIIGTELTNKITQLKGDAYNFGNFLTAIIKATDNLPNEEIENRAEAAWRYVVKNGYDPNNFDTNTPYLTSTSFDNRINAVGLDFADNSSNAILMATCQLSNGIWSNWKLSRVKGEEGKPGKSLNVKKGITYESKLEQNETYTLSSARTKFHNSIKSTLTVPTPAEGYLAIVYPYAPIEKDDSSIFWGDDAKGGALYMAKYTNGQWVDYYDENTVTPQDEELGDTHPSPNGHLILWDGDTWQDVGSIVGPAGPVSEICVKYAIDSTTQGRTYEFWNDTMNVLPKYVGFITYPESQIPDYIDKADDPHWNWQIFKGQDGFGYEYIFKATETNTQLSSIPDIPTEPQNVDWNSTPNVVPTTLGWSDEPIEPTKEMKYVWMCWRKYDYSTQTWTDFQGSTKTGQTNKARLWQVYANSIVGVNEVFHASSSLSPTETGFTADYGTTAFNNYWKSKDTVCPPSNTGGSTNDNVWGRQNKYLFNREIIQYTNSDIVALPAHLVGTWDSGIIGIQDYYCVHTSGENAPAMNGGTPTISGGTEGKTSWTTDTSKAKMDTTYKYLWNISKRTYSGNKQEDWSEPIVIGVYGKGENGVDRIYADLDNEMDTIQINASKEVLNVISDGKYISNLHLYKGADVLKFNKCEVSGETGLPENAFKLYYKTNESSQTWSPYTSGSPIQTGIEVIKMEISLAVGDKIPEYSNINFILTNTEDQIVRSVTYTLIGTTNPSTFSIVPSDSILVEKKSGDTTTIVPGSISVDVVEYIGGIPYPRTSNRTGVDGGFILKKCLNGDYENEETVTNYSSIITTGLSAGDRLTFRLHADTPNTPDGDDNTTPDIVMDTETIYVLKEGTDGANGTGYQYKYVRFDSQNSTSGYTNDCSLTNPDSNTPTFKFGTVVVSNNDVTSYAQGVDSRYTFEYRSERFGNPIDGWGTGWSNPVCIARNLEFDQETLNTQIQSIVEQQTSGLEDDIKDAIVGELDGQYALAGDFDQLSLAVTKMNADSKDHFATLENSVANATLTSDKNGYLLVDKPEYSIWFGKDYTASDPDERRNVDWILFKCNEVSISDNGGSDPIITEYTSQSLTPVISNNEDYYNDNKTKIIIVLQKYIATNTLESFLSDRNTTALNYYLNSEPNSVFDGQTISIKVKNDNSGEFKLFIDGIERDTSTYEESETPSQFDCVFRIDDDGAAIPATSYARLLIWTVLDLEEDNDSNNGYTSEDGDWLVYNNSLSWNVGVSEIDGDLLYGGTYNLAHTKTASVFEEPLVKSTNGYDDVFEHIDIFKQFGYQLIKDKNGVVIEAETNGKLSANIADSNPDMRFIPGNTSFENLVSILNGDLSSYPTTINDLPVGTTTTSYYLASKSESAVTDLPYIYDMFLTDSPGNGDNTFSFTNVSSFENQHRFAENSGSALDNKNNWCKCAVDTGTGYEIYVNQNNLATKFSINVTANTTYTFSLYTYSEANWDGIMISTSGTLTSTSNTSTDIKLGTSGDYIASSTTGYIGHCTGLGTTKTVTYTPTSSGTIYVYFRTNTSTTSGYNNTGCSYGKVVITPAIPELFTDITSGTYNGYRQYTNTSINNADDKEYVMDITSPYDELCINVNNSTFTVVSETHPSFKLSVIYSTQANFANSTTIILYEYNSLIEGDTPVSIPAISKQLLNEILFSFGTKLYFKFHIEYSESSLDSINIKYKFTTKNKITSDIATSSVNTGETYSIGLDEENISGTIVPSQITEYILGSGNQSLGYSYITELDKSVKSYFRKENVIDATVSMFTISSTIKDTQATLTFNVDQSSLKNNVQYMIIPAYFDNDTLDDINADADYNHFADETDFFSHGFVNNTKYNTVGKTWLNIPSDNTVTIDFNTAYRYYNEDPMGVNEDLNNKYFFTVVQKVTSWNTSEEYLTTFVTYNVTNTNFFSTTNNSQSRSSDSYNSYGFMLDKVTVSVNDRSVHLKLTSLRTQAKDSSGNPTNNYNDVRDEDKPYLIPTVTELATISQMVSDGIASTSIVVGVGEHAAAQVFQATEDGSSIWMEADEVGIKSTHFNLDKSGVTMMGDLYATDTEGNITAGVIGTDTSSSNDVKFFAGTKIPKVNGSYQDIKNSISNAPFKVYEDGSIILESKGGKTRIGSDGVLYASGAVIDGNIRAKEFVAENKETMNVESGSIDPATYSGTITKTTIIDGSTFSIMANGSIYDDGGSPYDINNGIYIKIIDDLLNDVDNSVIADEHLIGVPVLCMRYKGVEYVLSPASWKINATASADITNMYWNTVYNTQNVQIVQYTFNNPSNNNNNSRYYSSSTYNSNCTFYLFGYKKFISIIDSSPVLYQFTVRDWGDSSNINTKLNLLYNKKLISSNESTSSYGGAYTLYVPSAPLTYESKNVSNYSGGGLMIDETGCNIYNKFLYNNLSFGDHIHIYYLINQGYSGGQGWEEHIYSGNGGHNVTSDITSSTCKNTQNKWGDKKIINIIKNLLLAEDDINAGPLTCHWNTCVFGDGNFNDTGIVGGEFENYFPFDKNFDNYGSYYQPYGLFKAEIDCYPMLNISNYGKTKATTTNLIWTHVLYEIDTSYGYKGTMERKFSIIKDSASDYYNFSPSKIKFRVEFDLVFDFGTSSISNSESNILNYVNTFLNSNSLYSLIQSNGFREFSFEGVITADNDYNNNNDTVIIKTKAWLDYLSNY